MRGRVCQGHSLRPCQSSCARYAASLHCFLKGHAFSGCICELPVSPFVISKSGLLSAKCRTCCQFQALLFSPWLNNGRSKSSFPSPPELTCSLDSARHEDKGFENNSLHHHDHRVRNLRATKPRKLAPVPWLSIKFCYLMAQSQLFSKKNSPATSLPLQKINFIYGCETSRLLQ